ncbi:aconitate hydratase AcnA [Bordetella bronchialis]|uniref:Aconitate hydratase n=1 Tax=Bordetella bronchialis TaxID=463025 RepID=A0ABN4QX91_9BORD|nr:aconitate hydratase AcnA [Bordetella bronchialis]ANN65610.1 aconitate hydratase 1 [Bordetella bronchialis]
MTASISVGGRALRYTDIAAIAAQAGRDIHAFPYVIRVLLENLARHRAWGADVSEQELQSVLDWRSHTDAGLPLRVARVFLPDSSGLPVLQDLAALRDAVAKHGGDIDAVDARIPVDLIVDHSLQVTYWGDTQAVVRNMQYEFKQNAERYRFLKWAQQAFNGLRVFPPGTGIIHQVNLEFVSPVVQLQSRADGDWAYPDFVIGGDSHTPMINGIGVLGWGVGGIDAEAALLGHAYTFPVPEVVGVRLVGRIPPPALTTDGALLITQKLREFKVAGSMVEFFGPGVRELAVPERATIANMAPEYGATCGFFPVDAATIEYLKISGRDPDVVERVKAYCRANAFWRENPEETPPQFSRVLEIDLSETVPSMAGPRRPQDRLPLPAIPADFRARLHKPALEGGFAVPMDDDLPATALPADGDAPLRLPHGAVVLAAITSCTNTSNPAVMMAAGLVAKKAVERGMHVPEWVKTSLAPGSRTVTHYLQGAGLLQPLEALGFAVIGYGCTTCGGKSGSLPEPVVRAIERDGFVSVSVLSGNRNFEGRIHKLIRANYIGAPPMVVLYALAGRIDIDLDKEPIGRDRDGRPVFMRDVWPTPQEIQAVLPLANAREIFEAVYDPANLDIQTWREMDAPSGPRFPWDPQSLYLVDPPFFKDEPHGDSLAGLATALRQATVLAAFGDSLTTDHISPGGEIPLETPAGQYLADAGVPQREFNSYVARRCNFHVMTRATFGNIRIRNLLLEGEEGGDTLHFPDRRRMSIFDAANAYRQAGRSTIVIAGKEYGTGSSRDWAAKGTALLGVKAVIAESFERIHRANLIGMGVLPLAFKPGEGWRQLGLRGDETFGFENVEQGVRDGQTIRVTARGGDREIRFDTIPQVLTAAERRLMAEGGIPMSVLRGLLPDSVTAQSR